jgi:Na+/H+-dicarboxylate symporter
MGIRIIPYFVLTTCIAVSIGILLATIIKPGAFIDPTMIQAVMNENTAVSARTFQDLTVPERIANLIPTNFTQAALENNLLQIVIFAIIVGVVIINVPESTVKPFKDLCVAGQVISMKVISWAMMIAPYAVFGLLCNLTIKIGFSAITGVATYALTVLFGLILMLGVYALILVFIAKYNPLDFFKSIKEVQLLAFSTSSSAATMPFTIRASEENLNVEPAIARFVIPLGATINMDGTALYQAIAAIFLCQVFGVDLSLSETLLLIITTVGASIGTPATPGVGIVVLATILVGIGVPGEGIGLILGVDRILDMCRTTVNVTGDLTASTVMNRLLPLNSSKVKNDTVIA